MLAPPDNPPPTPPDPSLDSGAAAEHGGWTDGEALNSLSKPVGVISAAASPEEVEGDGRGAESMCGGVEGLGFGRRRRYSRTEMEALRFVDAEEEEEQRAVWWDEVYRGLESVVSQEYDALRATTTTTTGCNRKQKRRKKEASAIVGKTLDERNPSCLDVQNLAELICPNTFDCQDNDTILEDVCIEYNIINDGDDSSNNEYDSIRKPAFFVEGEPDFESDLPLDGLEYLRRVRWEAARIPKVKVAKLNSSKLQNQQTPYMPKIPEIAKCPPHLLPSKSWEVAFLADFSGTRQAFSWLESSCDQSSFTVCISHSTGQSDCIELLKKSPTLPVILNMDTVSRAVALRKRISTLETASVLSRDDCVWLFALCVTVDTPLDAETTASLRSLLRKSSSLLAEKSEHDDEVAMLSILVTITGKYFGQSEK